MSSQKKYNFYLEKPRKCNVRKNIFFFLRSMQYYYTIITNNSLANLNTGSLLALLKKEVVDFEKISFLKNELQPKNKTAFKDQLILCYI